MDLRGQLLKAGLIDQKQKRAADQQERAKKKKKKKRSAPSEVELQAQAYEAKLEERRQADREREEARKRAQAEEQRRARLRSTIERNEVRRRSGPRRFYFRAEPPKVASFDLPDALAYDLEDGRLFIALLAEDEDRPYKLVREGALAEVRSIDPSAVLFHGPSWESADSGGGPRTPPRRELVPDEEDGMSGIDEPDDEGAEPESTGPVLAPDGTQPGIAGVAEPEPEELAPGEQAPTGEDAGKPGWDDEDGQDPGAAENGRSQEAGPVSEGSGESEAPGEAPTHGETARESAGTPGNSAPRESSILEVAAESELGSVVDARAPTGLPDRGRG